MKKIINVELVTTFKPLKEQKSTTNLLELTFVCVKFVNFKIVCLHNQNRQKKE